MVHLTQALLKYIPDWYHLKKSSSNYFKRQAILYMCRYGKKREWSTHKNAINRYYYRLKEEQFYAADKSQARRDINRARIAAACEEHGYKYNYLQPTLAKLDINLNLSSMARLAIYEPKAFKTLVDISKEASSEELEPSNFSPSTILSKEEMPRVFKPNDTPTKVSH